MQKGNIGVTTENIFPIIKKFLYSDHEIFLRELVSNAVDATQKLKTLASKGEFKGEMGDLTIKVSLGKDTITISDRGIGLTAEEIDKYINQIAFSGANDFLEKYKDDANAIIGHFGLGFYSAFMVAKKVEIITKSHQEGAQAVKWTCDGSPEFTIENVEKESRGSDIILYIDDDCKEFLEETRISSLLTKYCRFLPIPIAFGKKKEWKDGKQVETNEDNVINETYPLWTRKPVELKDEDYKKFYRELYPMADEPLFWIHLNVDYPFNLTGILFFPKLGNNLNIEKDKIQLYQNQVFVTDEVKGIVPDFLMLLRGVIDSPDIPLNVSRSYLQADGAVKKISSYITKKVADKMVSLINENREDYNQKWNDIKIVIEYGMISEDKFYEKSDKFALYPTTDGTYYLWNELIEKIKPTQTDKDGKIVILYANNSDEQHSYIESAKEKGYEVLLLDSPIVPHLIQKLESSKENVSFARVDADHINNLIKKDEPKISKLNDSDKETLKKEIEESINDTKFTVQLEDLDSTDAPFTLTQPEFFRRMKDMQATGGGGMFAMGGFPEMYNLVVNANSDFAGELLKKDNDDEKKAMINQALDLAKLSQNLLKGKELTDFIKRSFESLK
jgi:molecular chaperone HtpG